MQQNQLNYKTKNIPNGSYDQYETCWIGNLTDQVPNSELEVYFKINAETIGKIHSVNIKKHENKNKYCFINFFKREDAQRAAEFFNGKKLYEFTLKANYIQKNNKETIKKIKENKSMKKVEHFKEKDTEQNENGKFNFKTKIQHTHFSGFHTCWIGNINDENSENDLKKFFSSQLESLKDNLVDIKFKQIDHSIQCFIYFTNKENAEQAVKIFNQSKLDGRILISLYKLYSSIHTSSSENFKPFKLSENKTKKEKNEEKEYDNYKREGEEADDSENDDDDDDEIESENEDDDNFFIKQEALSDDTDSSDGDDSFSVSSLISTYSNSNKDFSCAIYKKNLGFFKTFINRKIKMLKLESKNVEFQVFERKKVDLIIKIQSTDFLSGQNAENIVKSWKVLKKQLIFKKYEFDQIKSLRKELVAIIKNDDKKSESLEAFLKLDRRRKQVVLLALDPNKEQFNKLFDQIKTFCFDKITFKREFFISNSEHFDLLYTAYNSKSYKRKKNLETVNFEFDINSKKVTISAPKSVSDSLNLSYLIRVYSCNRDYVIGEKYALSFIKYQFRHFKKEFADGMCILKLSEEEISTKSSFQMIGLDKANVELNADKMKSFIENARVDSITIEENQFSKAKQIINEFREKKTQNLPKNYNDQENSNHKETYSIDLNFNEKKKKIFINGIDQEEIMQTKNYLLGILQGSMLTSKSIRTNKLLLNNLIENRELFVKLRAKYQNIQIHVSLNEQSIIRLIGEQLQINEAIKEINTELKNVSKDMIFDTIELEKSEFNFLLNKQEEILKIQHESNTLIQMDVFEKYGEIMLKDVLIEFVCGDIANLNVDAYVNPINQNMSLSSLNKTIFNKAGYFVRKQVELFNSTKNGESCEGRIFQTISGDLGIKRNSKIIHLVEPIRKSDQKIFESVLSNCIISTFKEAENGKSETIAIPAFSDDHSFETILNSTFNYINLNKKRILKRIIFISDQSSLVQRWTKVSTKNETKIEYLNKNILFLFGFGSDCEKTKKIFEKTFSRSILPYSSILMALLNYLIKDIEVNITIANKTIIIFGTINNLEKLTNELLKFNSNFNMNHLENSINSEKIKKQPKLIRQELEKSSVEYKKIFNKLMETFDECLLVEQVKIEKLKNKKLLKLYEGKKLQMEEKGFKINERKLFYSDSSSILNKIISSGFDTSLSREGNLGKGFYFSTSARLSLLFWNFNKTEKTWSIIYSNVALGEISECNNTDMALELERNIQNLKFNDYPYTIKLRLDNGEMFMLNENSRAYPVYLITIQNTF